MAVDEKVPDEEALILLLDVAVTVSDALRDALRVAEADAVSVADADCVPLADWVVESLPEGDADAVNVADSLTLLEALVVTV